MVLDKIRMAKIEEAGRKMTGIDYTDICFHCKCPLKLLKKQTKTIVKNVGYNIVLNMMQCMVMMGELNTNELRNLSLSDNDWDNIERLKQKAYLYQKI